MPIRSLEQIKARKLISDDSQKQSSDELSHCLDLRRELKGQGLNSKSVALRRS